jgi:hypothetical protein
VGPAVVAPPPVTALGLGHVHGRIGFLKKMRAVIRAVGVNRDANAGGQAETSVVLDGKGVAQGAQDLLGGDLLSAFSRSRLDYSRLRQ